MSLEEQPRHYTDSAGWLASLAYPTLSHSLLLQARGGSSALDCFCNPADLMVAGIQFSRGWRPDPSPVADRRDCPDCEPGERNADGRLKGSRFVDHATEILAFPASNVTITQYRSGVCKTTVTYPLRGGRFHE